MSITKFNAQSFFDNTAYFASKGRGLFKTSYPTKIINSKYVNKDKLRLGIKSLNEGIMAKGFNIPAQTFLTHSPFSYIGPTRKMPYAQLFNDISVDFILANKNELGAASIYYALVKWQEYIAGPIHKTVSIDIKSDSTDFGINYYEDYTVRATAELYSASSDTPQMIIDYSELYPLTIGNIQMDWDSEDSPIIIPVIFTFHYSQITSQLPPNVPTTNVTSA